MTSRAIDGVVGSLRDADATRRATLERVGYRAAVALAVLLGCYLRLAPVLAADFPLNDGGLFYLMTRELQQAHYSLPAFTAYNHASIPFAYPPFGFYLAGLIADLTGRPLLDVVRVLPAIVSALTLPAFFALACALLRSRMHAVIALFAFALLPRTFTWFIMGGGLTRAPGFLFAILMLHQAYMMYTRGESRFVISTALFGALAVLSHAENSWFAAYSAGFVFLRYDRDRRGLINSGMVAVAVVLLTAPWWGTVLRQHGVSPFLAAGQGGGYGNFSLAWIKTFMFSNEPQLTLVAVLGLIGIFVSLADGEWLLPVWLLSMIVLNPRNPETVAAVPLSLLAGVAMGGVLVPELWRRAQRTAHTMHARDRGARMSDVLPIALVSLMLAYAVGYSFLATRGLRRYEQGFQALTREDRDAMAWASVNSPRNARFIVLTGTADWFGHDATAEWFPALAERPNVATVQGYEWLPGRQFHRRIDRYKALAVCRTRTISCIEAWASASPNERFTHIYFRKEHCCDALEASLRASARYALLYDGPGAAIFAQSESP